MNCWHCNSELKLDFQTNDFSMKFYYCSKCDKWYEMKKEKARVNGAMPIRFSELETRPQIYPAMAANV